MIDISRERRLAVAGSPGGLTVTGRDASGEARWLNPAEFATRVRKLALDAHRVVKDPHTTTGEAAELSRQIDELREHARVSRLFEIDRWLQNAAELVKNRRSASRPFGLDLAQVRAL
jgi:hypothetical protein